MGQVDNFLAAMQEEKHREISTIFRKSSVRAKETYQQYYMDTRAKNEEWVDSFLRGADFSDKITSRLRTTLERYRRQINRKKDQLLKGFIEDFLDTVDSLFSKSQRLQLLRSFIQQCHDNLSEDGVILHIPYSMEINQLDSEIPETTVVKNDFEELGILLEGPHYEMRLSVSSIVRANQLMIMQEIRDYIEDKDDPTRENWKERLTHLLLGVEG